MRCLKTAKESEEVQKIITKIKSVCLEKFLLPLSWMLDDIPLSFAENLPNLKRLELFFDTSDNKTSLLNFALHLNNLETLCLEFGFYIVLFKPQNFPTNTNVRELIITKLGKENYDVIKILAQLFPSCEHRKNSVALALGVPVSALPDKPGALMNIILEFSRLKEFHVNSEFLKHHEVVEIIKEHGKGLKKISAIDYDGEDLSDYEDHYAIVDNKISKRIVTMEQI